MYFQNPPTNFIDKFVLIINPLQMNVIFFWDTSAKSCVSTELAPSL